MREYNEDTIITAILSVANAIHELDATIKIATIAALAIIVLLRIWKG